MATKKQGHGPPKVQPPSESVIDAPPQRQGRTKQALLLELIGRDGGATLTELTAATSWLPHTTRAAITRLRKRGHDITCNRIDGVSRYIIGSRSK